MSSGKKEKSSKPQMESQLIPARYQHTAAILVIFLSLIIFFHEIVFESRVFVAADTIASKSFTIMVNDAEQQGIFPLWNPYIFCGMPGYASLMVHGERYFDVTALVMNRAAVVVGFLLNNQDVAWVFLYYLLFGIGIYLLVYDKVQNKIAALVAGLAVMHSTFVIILIIVGHMTKIPVMAFFPFIFLLLERLRLQFNLFYSLLLIVLIHLMFIPSHIQMIFYAYFALGIYYLFYFIRALVKKEEWKGYIRSGTIFVVATGIAFAMTGDQYLSTLEYSKYSMRGSEPIVRSAQAVAKGPSTGGLDYDYATSWSFSPDEMLTFIIPSSHGFGWHSYKGVLSQNQEMRLNTYFGNMPFTDAPQYMGIVIVLLAGIGLWRNRKNPFVQYSAIVVIVSIFISFGKELPILYDLMFHYFPMFNKFRIPSMILILVQIFIPILAGFGIKSLIMDAQKYDEKIIRVLRYSLFGISGLLILSFIAKELFLSVYSMFFSQEEIIGSFSRSYGNNQMVLNELHKIVLGMVANDITVGLFIIGATLAVFYLFLKKRIQYGVLSAALVTIVLFDLWRINYKPMDTQLRKNADGHFNMPSYVSFLKQDTSLYRIMEFENGQPPYNNTLAYWRIQSAYGYQGAKMRQIQDVFDVSGLGNPLVWSLMNVKYIISDRPDSNNILVPVYSGGGKHILYNRAELPRAFFVNRFEVMKGIDILTQIKNMSFDPRDVVYFMDDPDISLDKPEEGARAEVTKYGIQDLEMKVTATGNNLLFLSEAWYPEGWKAYRNNEEIPIYRVNYMFRGIVVPKGEHTITMKFEPQGYIIGKNLSLWMNVIIIGGLAYCGVMFVSRKKK